MTLAYDTGEVDRRYRHYRLRILLWSLVGYALFYFVRKNLAVAMPVMEKQLGITKTDLGLVLTLHGVIYGVSKFINGFIGDRVNARWFMALGLFCSAMLNIAFGLSSGALALGMFWVLNGWVQGMGFPPCARLLTHWFSPKELATKMSVWNMSHGLGAAGVFVMCGFLLDHFNNWRIAFFVPAAMAIACSGLLAMYLRDTPESVGLPELAGTIEPHDRPPSELLIEKVFSNPYIWILSVANFFVYTIRYAVLDWAVTMLNQSKGVTLAHAGLIVAGFEVAGVVGALCAGWLTDRLFGGRGARMSVFCMILAALAIWMFWRVPPGHLPESALLLMAAGFFVYGPQALVGIAAANLATKRCAATAVGLTGLFGYASTVASGWGLGWLVQHHGWDHAYAALIAVAGIATAVFLIAWNAPRDGYGS
jgi:OPA family glycerol-3-phosphate transporter-like MFS transporter/OPA family sugar phosphate sensor protein UhpC-like MFS transporter